MSVFDGHKLRATRITIKFVGSFVARSWKVLAGVGFGDLATLVDMVPMFGTPYKTGDAEMNLEAQRAAIGGTREMMRRDEMDALIAALIDCRAVPRNVMAKTLKGLAGAMIAKARGELETDFATFPSELFDRARELDGLAARLR